MLPSRNTPPKPASKRGVELTILADIFLAFIILI